MDAAALGWLGLKGASVAALPLAYVFFSRDPAKFRKLAWVTAFLTLDLIMFGSFTRLTDSGLGCPDWPGCYGHSNPISAGEPIRAAETAQPTGPVTMTKAWIEMLHRYFAMGVGFLIIILTVQAWRRPRRDGLPSPWLATAALAWVCVQGAFGALTVTMKLQPIIVTAHLLGGMVLLALLVALAVREARAGHSRERNAESAQSEAPCPARCHRANRARWLGQQQLCGACLSRLSAMPGRLAADDGLSSMALRSGAASAAPVAAT